MNKLFVIGNVGAEDGVLGKLPSETPVLNFNFANNEVSKDRDGKKQTSTIWYKVAAYGSLATRMHKFVVSGKQLAISGKLRVKDWKTDGGEAKKDLIIIADDITLLGGGGNRHEEASAGEQSAEVETAYAPGAVGAVDDDGEVMFPPVVS